MPWEELSPVPSMEVSLVPRLRCLFERFDGNLVGNSVRALVGRAFVCVWRTVGVSWDVFISASRCY